MTSLAELTQNLERYLEQIKLASGQEQVPIAIFHAETSRGRLEPRLFEENRSSGWESLLPIISASRASSFLRLSSSLAACLCATFF